MSEYPRDQRPQFYAIQYTRLLLRAGVPQELGCDVFTLLCAIVAKEDTSGYCRAVDYWNSQLMELLGMRKVETLMAARKRAIDAGWLHYEPPPNGSRIHPARYWVTVPAAAHERPPGDETIAPIPRPVPPNGIGDGIGQPPIPSPIPTPIPRPVPRPIPPDGIGRGILPYPSPIPIPLPRKDNTTDAVGDECVPGKRSSEAKRKKPKEHGYSAEYLDFWAAFPSGRKSGKASAYKAWQRALSHADASTIIAAATEYAASDVGKGEYVKSPEAWLNGHCWEDDRAAWRSKSSRQRTMVPDLTTAPATPGDLHFFEEFYNESQNRIHEFWRIAQKIHNQCPARNQDDGDLVAKIIALQQAGQLAENDVAIVVESIGRERPERPIGYLRASLRNKVPGFEGMLATVTIPWSLLRTHKPLPIAQAHTG